MCGLKLMPSNRSLSFRRSFRKRSSASTSSHHDYSDPPPAPSTIFSYADYNSLSAARRVPPTASILSPTSMSAHSFPNGASAIGTRRSEKDSALVAATTRYAREYMSSSHFDSSHDFSHVQRVLRHALHILDAESRAHPSTPYDPLVVTLAALLHDISDKKYLSTPGTRTVTFVSDIEDPETEVKRILLRLGAPEELARTVQVVVKNISYSTEVLDPAHNRGVILQHPELAIVQDADRLDAIGAIGIGRAFTYGGAKAPNRGMHGTMAHSVEKLEKLQGMMKTAEGRRMAKARAERLRVFRGWWEEEMAMGEVDPRR